jgi:hypothetical protein
MLGNWTVFNRQQKARGHEYARVLRYVGGRRTQRLFTAWRQLGETAERPLGQKGRAKAYLNAIQRNI